MPDIKKIIRYKRIKKYLKSKSFWGSILFAIALWSYTSLNSDYRISIKVPLTVNLPDNRAIETDLPDNITVEVTGIGWQLFNIYVFGTGARSLVDLSGIDFVDSTYIISRSELMENIDITNARPIDVNPQPIMIKVGSIGQYAVPVLSRVVVEPREDYTIVGNVMIKPDLINITGNDKVVRQINEWFTKDLTINDVHKSFSMMIPLSDSLSNVIKKSTNEVKLSCNVEMAAEITFYDIPVNLRGRLVPEDHELLPMHVSVTVRGGVNSLSELTMDEVAASINYIDVINDTLGLIKPQITLPEEFQVLKVNPPFIYHMKRVRAIKGINRL